MWSADLSEFAKRIVEIELSWLRAAGPVSAGLGIVMAMAIGVAVGRLVSAARQPPRAQRRP